MKKILWLGIILFVFGAGYASAFGYNYIGQEEFKQWLENGRNVIIADIQVREAFKKHHFKGAIETNAYPVKSEQARNRIDPVVSAYQKSGTDVVVVCPRGGGGAKRCYDYLESRAVPEGKLHILKGGMEKWPYKELVEAGD